MMAFNILEKKIQCIKEIRNFLGILCIVLTSINCTAEVITVGQAIYNIQNAIYDAQSGDTILVEPGSYFGHLDIINKQELTIIGLGGNEGTVLDGMGLNRVITVNNAQDIVIKDFTIMNGLIEGLIANGGGISISSSTCVLEGLIVKENYIDGDISAKGAGIWAENCTRLDISQCIIEKNIIGELYEIQYESTGLGGGLFCNNVDEINIDRTEIKANNIFFGGSGSAMYVYNGNVNMSNSYVADHYVNYILLGIGDDALQVVNVFSDIGAVDYEFNVLHCTFENSSPLTFYVDGTVDFNFVNSILWTSYPSPVGSNFSSGINFQGSGEITLDHSIFYQHFVDFVGEQCLNTHPYVDEFSFELSNFSPAINIGKEIPDFTMDIEGKDRDIYPDIGCYEFAGIVEPIADFEYEIIANCMGEVLFYNQNPLNDDYIDVHWDFGDGSSSNDWNGSHYYELPGEYTVTLTNCLYDDCFSTSQEVNYENDILPISYDIPEFGNVGEALTFQVDISGFTNVTWIFGDDGQSFEENATHIYNQPGSYMVALFVTNDEINNCTYHFTATVTIGQPSGFHELNEITIQYDNTKLFVTNQNIVAIQLWDLQGKLVTSSRSNQLPMHQIISGIYLLQYELQNGTQGKYKVYISLTEGT